MIDSKAELGENAGVNDKNQAELAEWQQRAEKAEAQAASYRQALEAIRLLTLDPWQMGIAANVRGLCEEALGKGKP